MDLSKFKDPKNTLILADFDKTITKAYVNGIEIPSIKSLISRNHYLSEEYTIEADRLFAIYSKIEKDISLDYDYRLKSMQEWWEKNFKIMIQYGLTKQIIDKLSQVELIQLREGAKEFFTKLNQFQIPLIIISASGAGEVIPHFFKNNNILFNDQYFIVNKFIWDKSDTAVDIQKPFIHSMNKSSLTTRLNEIPTNIATTENIILLGDGVEDIQMAKNFNYKNILKIGFYNYNDSTYIEEYQKRFDIVVPKNGGFKVVNEVLFNPAICNSEDLHRTCQAPDLVL
jgi:HAD superfamily hydrolase (TIGR01544 family)